MLVTEGSTNVTVPMYAVEDVGGTNPGEPKTGLLFSDIETGGSASYQRQGAARTDFTLVTQTAAGAHTPGGFVLVDDTEMAGVYRLDIPDLAVAAGVDYVIIYLRPAAANNCIFRPLKIDLTTVDLRDGVRGGMTALPNAAADAAGGLPISDAGGLDMDNLNTLLLDIPTVAEFNARTLLAASYFDVASDNVIVGTNNDKTGYSISGTKTTLDALNDISAANVNSEVDTALADIGLDHLINSALPTSWAVDVAAGSVFDQIADDGTAAYDRTTDSLQAVRDRGDSAWITGGGGGITDILNVVPLVPFEVDLANTATVRIGLMLTNAVDDLPSTAEIDPGTISIHRKAIGGTSWSAVVTDGACSEAAGLAYYDEVFDSGTGYAEGDTIRVTFKSQKITVAANDYEISDATGRFFYTSIRQTMRGTNSAALATDYTSARAGYLDNLNGHTAQTGDSFARLGAPAGASLSADVADVPTVAEFNARTLVAADYFDPANDAVANVTTVGTLSGHTAQSGDSFAQIGTAGAGLTDLGGMSVGMKAEVESEANDALVANGLDHLAIRQNTAQAGGALTITLDASASATDAEYVPCTILLTGGTGAGQSAIITAYNGTTKVATVWPAWGTQPDATTTFVVFFMGRTDVTTISQDGAAADNLEADYDLSGYTKSNSTIGQVDEFGTAARSRINAEVVDVLNVDTLVDGKTIAAALQIIGSVAAGEISGAGTGTEVFVGLDGVTTRVTVTVDGSGNRSAVVYA